MSNRRSAAAALNLETKVEDFIRSGMPTTKPEVMSPVIEKEIKTLSESDEVENEVEIEVRQPRPKKTLPRNTRSNSERKEKVTSPAVESPTYARTLARARIQKSVRFLPNLIAEFEEYSRIEEMAGRKPISIQDALNEALKMWISKIAEQINS